MKRGRRGLFFIVQVRLAWPHVFLSTFREGYPPTSKEQQKSTRKSLTKNQWSIWSRMLKILGTGRIRTFFCVLRYKDTLKCIKKTSLDKKIYDSGVSTW